jgi:hypothetical protein
MIDLQKFINEAADKLKSNPQLLQEFQSEPVKTLEKILNVDLPDDQVQAVVTAVKAKMASGGIADKLGSLFK